MKKKNPEFALQDGERLDDLLIRGMKIFQHESQFCFTLDAVLLAHFAGLKAKSRCADLGTGTGVIAMLLAARGALHVDAVELNPVMAELAARSVRFNELEAAIAVHQGDFRNLKQLFPAGCMDLVVSNPPYRQLAGGQVNRLDAVALARHEITGNLHDVVTAAKYLLKYRGRFAMVHLPERLSEIMVELHAVGIEPKRLRMVQPRAGRRPTLALIEGVAGANPGLLVEKPLIVYEAEAVYTEEILQYYKEMENRGGCDE